MAPLIMPEAFREIARLSTEYRSEENDTTSRFEWERREGPEELYNALSKLSDMELKRLIGWVRFGRDYAESANPEMKLSDYIAEARVSRRDEAIAYIIGKPIEEYLSEAEQRILSANRDGLHPLPEVRDSLGSGAFSGSKSNLRPRVITISSRR